MKLLQKHGYADFRKTLYIWANLHGGYSTCQLWDLQGRAKADRGTVLFRLHPREFSKFAVTEFKKVVLFPSMHREITDHYS